MYLPTGVLRRYELLRSVDDAAAQMIFQSEDPAVASFTDVLIEGNRKYTYRLRNTMARGVVLESRDIALHPYQRRLDFNIVEAPNAFVALTPATAFASPALALLATSDAISVREVNQTGYVGSPHALPVPNRAGLRLGALLLLRFLLGLLLFPMCCSVVFYLRPERCNFLRLREASPKFPGNTRAGALRILSCLLRWRLREMARFGRVLDRG